jgi:flagellar FliJ protein
MTSQQTLTTMLALLTDAENKAAKKLGEATQRLAAEEEKRAMLEQFRNEYQEKLRQALAEEKPPALIANHQQFLSRLDEAVAIQQTVCAQAAAQRDQAQQAWLAAMGKRKAFDLLLAKEKERAAKAEAKAAQKLLDEWASQHHLRHTTQED